ncbi:uncharacterized protein METZ01_LOCUS418710, partial [marine metagenome]
EFVVQTIIFLIELHEFNRLTRCLIIGT